MKTIGFFGKLIALTLGKLCRQPWLLAGLALLCLVLPLCIAPAAETVLSEGVAFDGMHLAITGPEGDPVPELVAQLLPGMEDVSRYCQVSAMGYDEALEALEEEQVTAVLVLPAGFIDGVLTGANPSVELIVPADKPLESLLTLWVGQSASDLLAAVQSSIYAVLEIYSQSPMEGLSYSDVVGGINLRFISWTLNRQDMFRVQQIAVTEQLPVGLHYGLSLLAYLLLAAAPFLKSIYEGSWIRSQRRLLAAGRRPMALWLAALIAGWVVLFPVTAAALLLNLQGNAVLVLAVAALGSLFCCAFAGLCCMVSASTASCGVVSFLGALVFLTAGGGVLPPVMLPKTLRALIGYSPVTWLRNLWAVPAGYELPVGQLWALTIGTVVMIGLTALLYRRTLLRREDAL